MDSTGHGKVTHALVLRAAITLNIIQGIPRKSPLTTHKLSDWFCEAITQPLAPTGIRPQRTSERFPPKPSFLSV